MSLTAQTCQILLSLGLWKKKKWQDQRSAICLRPMCLLSYRRNMYMSSRPILLCVFLNFLFSRYRGSFLRECRWANTASIANIIFVIIRFALILTHYITPIPNSISATNNIVNQICLWKQPMCHHDISTLTLQENFKLTQALHSQELSIRLRSWVQSSLTLLARDLAVEPGHFLMRCGSNQFL